MKATRYEAFLAVQLKNRAVKREYDSLQKGFELAVQVIELRRRNNLTQAELARRIGTSQPAIARLESGTYRNLTLSFLRRVAGALGAEFEIHLRRKKA